MAVLAVVALVLGTGYRGDTIAGTVNMQHWIHKPSFSSSLRRESQRPVATWPVFVVYLLVSMWPVPVSTC